ncbi:hypothetical protein J6590_009147 [Homalodisca vitripennis]|nr:hypothetical protein J6590_009147 [Homalodisca vitripennis]
MTESEARWPLKPFDGRRESAVIAQLMPWVPDLALGVTCLILPSEIRAKKLSLPLNVGTNGLKVTYEPTPTAGRRAACNDKIAQRSPIQAAATFDVA